jgi:hypothetical protein
LQSVILEREKILYPGKRDYVTDKVNAKPERVTKLELKIKQVKYIHMQTNKQNKKTLIYMYIF